MTHSIESGHTTEPRDRWDCIVCGEICVDLPVFPVPLETPLADHTLTRVAPILPGGGGLVSNSAAALARLGCRVAAVGLVGDDPWADMLIELLEREGVAPRLQRVAAHPTSATAVLIGGDGAHFFAHHSGASRLLDARRVLAQLDLFAQSRYALFGYYGLGALLEQELPTLLPQIRAAGCLTALDSAGGGGGWRPLEQILPALDVYVPSYEEARSQTGQSAPRDMIGEYRRVAPRCLLGVKLGAAGALLSPAAGEWLTVASATPPGDVVDTTGAGDCFYAGLLAGLARGLSVEESGRLAAAAGACSVTAVGAVAGLPRGGAVWQMAGLAAAAPEE